MLSPLLLDPRLMMPLKKDPLYLKSACISLERKKKKIKKATQLQCADRMASSVNFAIKEVSLLCFERSSKQEMNNRTSLTPTFLLRLGINERVTSIFFNRGGEM